MRMFMLLLFMSCMNIFSVSGQKFTLPNEKVIYSFITENGKLMELSCDTNEGYLVYRFGKKKPEMEYPLPDKSSWSKFKYSYYFRGGGAGNEGLDLNYLSFKNKDHLYVIYSTYSAADEDEKIGIKIKDLKSGKTSEIKGKNNTTKGSLIELRNNELLDKSEELFD